MFEVANSGISLEDLGLRQVVESSRKDNGLNGRSSLIKVGRRKASRMSRVAAEFWWHVRGSMLNCESEQREIVGKTSTKFALQNSSWELETSSGFGSHVPLSDTYPL